MIKRACTNYVGSEDITDKQLLEGAHKVVIALKEEANRRKKILFTEGVSKLSPKIARKYNIGTEWLIIDELAVITEDMMSTNGKAVNAFIQDLQWLVRMGPKYGILTVLATQRPSKDSVPSTIRGLISFRIAFYIADSAGSLAITGKAGPSNRADLLDPEQKGVAIVVGEGRFRAHLVETFDLSRVCSFAMSLRAQYAAGERPVEADADYPEPVRTMLQIMDERKVDEISTSDLIDALRAMGHDRVTERNLADSLKQFDISPIRYYGLDKTRKRGYKRSALESVPKTVYTPSRSVPRTEGDGNRTDRRDGEAADLDTD
jgi:S-DNA-T family DNA segregation ATPase FtsK/SpoIIIE